MDVRAIGVTWWSDLHSDSVVVSVVQLRRSLPL